MNLKKENNAKWFSDIAAELINLFYPPTCVLPEKALLQSTNLILFFFRMNACGHGLHLGLHAHKRPEYYLVNVKFSV
jgi:hypothetical protein